MLPCLCRCGTAPAPIHVRSTCCRQSSALDYGKVYAGQQQQQQQQRITRAPSGLDFQTPPLIHTALILKPHGCTQSRPCSEGLGPRVTRSWRFPNRSKKPQALAENQGLFFPFAAAHVGFALRLFPPCSSPDLALYPMDAAARPGDAPAWGPLTPCQDGSLAAPGWNPPPPCPASHPGQERCHPRLGTRPPPPSSPQQLNRCCRCSWLLPRLSHTRSITWDVTCQLGSDGSDGRTGVLVPSAGAGGQQEPAARAQPPGKATRCPLAGEDVRNSAQGTHVGRDSLRGAAPCSWHAPALLRTYPLPPRAPIPWPVPLSHCHTPRGCKAHGLPAEPNARNL